MCFVRFRMEPSRKEPDLRVAIGVGLPSPVRSQRVGRTSGLSPDSRDPPGHAIDQGVLRVVVCHVARPTDISRPLKQKVDGRSGRHAGQTGGGAIDVSQGDNSSRGLIFGLWALLCALSEWSLALTNSR